MNLQELEIENHAKNILLSRRIKGKIVFLCEGNIESVKNVGLNPSFYRRLEKIPDSNFYTNCLPKQMRAYKTPQFFNCGSRNDVINVFFKLQELHKQNPTNSYLDINKLFAIVDLDIQTKEIDNYQFSDTEKIFFDLYTNLKINYDKLPNHRIFTTGLIHKEAYFLLPELQNIFDNSNHKLRYKENSFNLEEIYKDIINDFDLDKDLEINFNKVSKRLDFSHLDISSIATLKSSFINEIEQKIDCNLIKMLFLIRKIKPYWKEINTTDSIQSDRLREQLSLQIAKFYSNQNNDNFHLNTIFKFIYQQYEN